MLSVLLARRLMVSMPSSSGSVTETAPPADFCFGCVHLASPGLPSGATVNVGIDPSKVIVTKLKIDKDRRYSAALPQLNGCCSLLCFSSLFVLKLHALLHQGSSGEEEGRQVCREGQGQVHRVRGRGHAEHGLSAAYVCRPSVTFLDTVSGMVQSSRCFLCLE